MKIFTIMKNILYLKMEVLGWAYLGGLGPFYNKTKLKKAIPTSFLVKPLPVHVVVFS
jgi:hypothetical protein